MLDENTTIIVLEDELAHAEAIKRTFNRHKCNVLVAFSIQEYYTIIKTVSPDIVFTDLNLPDGKAFMILEPDSEKQKFPIVVMTSFGDESIAVQAIKMGAIDYIVKSESTITEMHRIADRTLREWQQSFKTKQIEKELHESEYRYKLLAENTSDTVILFDKNINILYISPSVTKVRGYSIADLHSISLQDQMTVESYNRFETLLNVALNPQNINSNTPILNFQIELDLYKKNGTNYWSENVITIIPTNDKAPISILWSSRNINERKIAEIQLQKQNAELKIAKEKAEESDNLKSAFLANVSHEIRTPMNGILGFAEFLRKPEISQETREHYIDIINSCGKQLLNIITDIIEVSKIETNQIKVQKSATNINSILQKVYSNLEITIKQKEIVLLLQSVLKEEDNYINTDNQKLQQVLSNLVENAIKFTDTGTVEFGCTVKDTEFLEFYVKDTGIGIAKESQTIIFDRFRRIELPNVEARGGTGLGLAICKSYVEFLGGSIWIDSEIGKGSTFYFTIPLEHKETIVQNGNGNNSIKNKTFKNKCILVAEDDDVNFLYLQEILSRTEAIFLRAKNGKQAVELIESNSTIDLILMDIKMPIMSGLDATIAIRKMRKNVPIIAQTAYAFEEEKQHALQLGCNDYISKPLKRENLIALIEKYINQ